MKFLKKLKSSNFWVSMISAVVLILQAVFNVEIKAEYLSQIIMAMLGFLVMSGIVTDNNTQEMTINKNVDIENVKETVTNILAQMSTTLETSMSGLVKQIENVNTATSVKTEGQAVNNHIVVAEQAVKEEVKPAEVIEEKPQVVEPVRVENQMSIETILPIQEVNVKAVETAKVDEQNTL